MLCGDAAEIGSSNATHDGRRRYEACAPQGCANIHVQLLTVTNIPSVHENTEHQSRPSTVSYICVVLWSKRPTQLANSCGFAGRASSTCARADHHQIMNNNVNMRTCHLLWAVGTGAKDVINASQNSASPSMGHKCSTCDVDEDSGNTARKLGSSKR
jgi:hypothetical protein